MSIGPALLHGQAGITRPVEIGQFRTNTVQPEWWNSFVRRVRTRAPVRLVGPGSSRAFGGSGHCRNVNG